MEKNVLYWALVGGLAGGAVILLQRGGSALVSKLFSNRAQTIVLWTAIVLVIALVIFGSGR